ncbi:hypothetical protein [Streptomyces sp. NPDC048295]|uniref:hypothetical protein n=1 Tax=Streptomyces sp. NPDC048295 TaxID=3154617 RepID=UPI0034249EE0
MKIVVHDTASAMFDLLHSPLEERPDALRDMLRPLQSVLSAVVDIDTFQLHTTGSGFRIDREDPRYLTALRQMRDAGVWDRIESCLAAGWERLSGAVPEATARGPVLLPPPLSVSVSVSPPGPA